MGLKAHAFTGTATAEGVTPTALGIRRLCFPALPGGANFCRTYGAWERREPSDLHAGRMAVPDGPTSPSMRAGHGMLAPTGKRRRRGGWSRRRQARAPGTACGAPRGNGDGVTDGRGGAKHVRRARYIVPLRKRRRSIAGSGRVLHRQNCLCHNIPFQVSKSVRLSSRERTSLFVTERLAGCRARVYWPFVQYWCYLYFFDSAAGPRSNRY